MGKIWTIIQKNFNQFIKLKHSSLVTIAAPLLTVLLAIVLLSQQTNIIKVGFYSAEDNQQIYDNLDKANFVLIEKESVISCTTPVKEGKLNGCVVLKDEGNQTEINLFITQPNRYILEEINELEWNNSAKITPDILEVKHLANNLFTIILILIIMLSGILLSSTFIIAEKKSSSYFRNHITPTHDYIFVVARFLTTFIIVAIITIIITSALSSLFRITIWSDFLPILITLALIVSIYTLLGILFGHIFIYPELNILFIVIISCVSILFSTTILTFKPESIMNYIVMINPFELGTSLLNTILYTQYSWLGLSQEWILLMVYCLVLFLIVFKVQSSTRFSTFFKIHKKQYTELKKRIESEVIGIRDMHLKEIFKQKEPSDVDKAEQEHKSILKKAIENKQTINRLQTEIDEIDKEL